MKNNNLKKKIYFVEEIFNLKFKKSRKNKVICKSFKKKFFIYLSKHFKNKFFIINRNNYINTFIHFNLNKIIILNLLNNILKNKISIKNSLYLFFIKYSFLFLKKKLLSISFNIERNIFFLKKFRKKSPFFYLILNKIFFFFSFDIFIEKKINLFIEKKNYFIYKNYINFINKMVDIFFFNNLLIKNKFLKINLKKEYTYSFIKKNKYTVLRSPHIDKKSKEQFEKRTYKVFFFLPEESIYLIKDEKLYFFYEFSIKSILNELKIE